MDTEDVVNIYNGMLLSQENNEIMSLHQHGCNQRLSFGVKRVRKRQISYGITYTWNLKHDTVKLSMKQKQTHRQREQTGGCQGGWVSRRMEWEAGVRCKLLYRDKINNKVLLHSSADFIFWAPKYCAWWLQP